MYTCMTKITLLYNVLLLGVITWISDPPITKSFSYLFLCQYSKYLAKVIFCTYWNFLVKIDKFDTI